MYSATCLQPLLSQQCTQLSTSNHSYHSNVLSFLPPNSPYHSDVLSYVPLISSPFTAVYSAIYLQSLLSFDPFPGERTIFQVFSGLTILLRQLHSFQRHAIYSCTFCEQLKICQELCSSVEILSQPASLAARAQKLITHSRLPSGKPRRLSGCENDVFLLDDYFCFPLSSSWPL